MPAEDRRNDFTLSALNNLAQTVEKMRTEAREDATLVREWMQRHSEGAGSVHGIIEKRLNSHSTTLTVIKTVGAGIMAIVTALGGDKVLTIFKSLKQ